MAEHIEREATCKDCIHYSVCIFHHNGDEYKKCVHFKNKADVAEVRHGEWKDSGDCDWRCTNCDDYFALDIDMHPIDDCGMNYCPNCGAKMDGKGEGE